MYFQLVMTACWFVYLVAILIIYTDFSIEDYEFIRVSIEETKSNESMKLSNMDDEKPQTSYTEEVNDKNEDDDDDDEKKSVTQGETLL